MHHFEIMQVHTLLTKITSWLKLSLPHNTYIRLLWHTWCSNTASVWQTAKFVLTCDDESWTNQQMCLVCQYIACAGTVLYVCLGVYEVWMCICCKENLWNWNTNVSRKVSRFLTGSSSAFWSTWYIFCQGTSCAGTFAAARWLATVFNEEILCMEDHACYFKSPWLSDIFFCDWTHLLWQQDTILTLSVSYFTDVFLRYVHPHPEQIYFSCCCWRHLWS